MRPPLAGDEREQLVGWLDHLRSLVRVKCEGLSEGDAHKQLLPTSPLTTVAGLVAHLRWVEFGWFQQNLGGVPDTGQTPWTPDGHPDAEMFVDDVPLAQLLDEYDGECARSNEVVAAMDLGDLERVVVRDSGQASVRYVLCHMIEETARHLGHLDIVRELLDGGVGYESMA